MNGAADWYMAENGKPVGPMTLDELAARVSGSRQAPPVAGGPPPISYASSQKRTTSDIIDYEIFGSEMQYVEVTLDPGETVLAEAGVMMYMDTGITMQTVFGDPSQQNQGLLGKIASAGKRMITGESLFVTTFTN